jgi:hypothetical protein
MKKIAVIFMMIGLIAFIIGTVATAQEKAAEQKAAPAKIIHKYVGSAKCKICHNSPAKGEQYKKWSESAHAKAFEILASEKAIAVGKTLAVDKPQESDKCLVCHVTAFGVPADQKDVGFNQIEGVGCEVCHGPGSDYKDMKIMKDKAAAMGAGLLIPDVKTCLNCHNEKSPTYRKFVFADAAKLIAHPIPREAPK